LQTFQLQHRKGLQHQAQLVQLRHHQLHLLLLRQYKRPLNLQLFQLSLTQGKALLLQRQPLLQLKFKKLRRLLPTAFTMTRFTSKHLLQLNQLSI
jgi:hypothetical protein